MNTDQLHADTRSCGELSCEECNERTEALRNEIARLTSELSALQTECDHLRITRAEFKKKVTDVAEENAALREEREWRDIATAPKGRKIIAGYLNVLGKWRSVMARYYPHGTLEAEDGSGAEFAAEGWYEESETHETLLQLDAPTHWLPLPQPPALAADVKEGV